MATSSIAHYDDFVNPPHVPFVSLSRHSRTALSAMTRKVWGGQGQSGGRLVEREDALGAYSCSRER